MCLPLKGDEILQDYYYQNEPKNGKNGPVRINEVLWGIHVCSTHITSPALLESIFQ